MTASRARASRRPGPDHAQIAAVNGVMDYMDAVADRHGHAGQARAGTRGRPCASLFRAHETALLQPLLDFLAQHPKVRLIGRTRAAERAPTVAFTVEGKSSADVASATCRVRGSASASAISTPIA